MPAPLYDVLLIAHVAAALIGFGSLAVASVAARRGRESRDPVGDEWLARFFRQGTDWPGRAILLVPVIGAVMLFVGDRTDIPKVWPWIGLALWVVAAGATTGRGWPAEREAQGALAFAQAAGSGPGEVGAVERFRTACARMERAQQLATVCGIVAIVFMVWQPGSS